MKKILCVMLSCLLIISGASGAWAVVYGQAGMPPVPFSYDIAINSENFHDPGFRSYVMDIDEDENGLLGIDEILSVKDINICDEAISSLKGIEFFVVLVNLD